MPSSSTTPSPPSALPNSLFAYLTTVLPGWRNPTTVKKFDTGQSNPTYCLTSAASGSSAQPSSTSAASLSTGPSSAASSLEDASVQTVVLRAKPKGKILDRTAHRVDREFGLLRAIGEHQARTGHEAVKVPKVFALCEDETVFGSVFYLMEFLQGQWAFGPALDGCRADHRVRLYRRQAASSRRSCCLPSSRQRGEPSQSRSHPSSSSASVGQGR